MVKVALDTSVLIEEIRRGSDLYNILIKKMYEDEIVLLIPVVVLMELWAGKSMDDKKTLKRIEKKLRPFYRIEVSEKVCKRAGEIARRGWTKGVDALIAACCIENKAKLATLNVKDFEKVEGLKMWKN